MIRNTNQIVIKLDVRFSCDCRLDKFCTISLPLIMYIAAYRFQAL